MKVTNYAKLRCQARLILSVSFSSDLSLWLESHLQNPVLGLPDIAWSSMFLQLERNFFNNLVTVLCWTTPPPFTHIFGTVSAELMAQSELVKHKFPNKDKVARSFVRLSNHTWSEAMHNVSAHWLLRSTKANAFISLNCLVYVICALMDPHTWPCKSRTTSTNIHSAAMWGYGMLSWRPT